MSKIITVTPESILKSSTALTSFRATTCAVVMSIACLATQAHATFDITSVDVGSILSNNYVAGTNTQTITTGANNTAVTTSSSNIATGETVNIQQPTTSSTFLNQIASGNPTTILGTLKSNGNVVLLNPNGVVFGNGGTVDVSGLVASTGTITNLEEFDANGTIDLSDITSGAVTIETGASITIKNGGLAAFVAPSVVNSGIITANLGKVALASGDAVTVDLYGDGLVEFATNAQADGAIITNTGTILMPPKLP